MGEFCYCFCSLCLGYFFSISYLRLAVVRCCWCDTLSCSAKDSTSRAHTHHSFLSAVFLFVGKSTSMVVNWCGAIGVVSCSCQNDLVDPVLHMRRLGEAKMLVERHTLTMKVCFRRKIAHSWIG